MTNTTHVRPSAGWSDAVRPGPARGMKITPAYATHVARDAFMWTWPLVNMLTRRAAFTNVTELAMAGPIPVSPLNRLGMLTDYIAWDERIVACPNQDVVYGMGILALDRSPVVVQVPDFGDRFWVYQIVDSRTDSFAPLGKMYGTTPGFYVLAGPDWAGDVPRGITGMFRASTSTGVVIPRVFQDDSPDDNRALQPLISQIVMYPLAEYDGTMKTQDWHSRPDVGSLSSGDQETQWVAPENFVAQLPGVLADAPPLPGEEARYAELLAVLDAAAADAGLRDAMTQGAIAADAELVRPLFQFRNWGLQLPHHWSTIRNNAAFGTDYFTRTAAAKANIFVNAPNETCYFYQDLDATGQRLNGEHAYTVTFAPGATPPVRGFWSLTLYNEHHFFVPNEINRYSVGTKSRGMQFAADGSLTVFVRPDRPEESRVANWLPSPKGGDFSLYVRAYWPETSALDGSWTPPPVVRAM